MALGIGTSFELAHTQRCFSFYVSTCFTYVCFLYQMCVLAVWMVASLPSVSVSLSCWSVNMSGADGLELPS